MALGGLAEESVVRKKLPTQRMPVPLGLLPIPFFSFNRNCRFEWADIVLLFTRYDEKRESPEKPLPFPPELRNRVLESCDLNHLVEDAMKQWEGNGNWLPGFHTGISIISSELNMPGSYCMELRNPRIPSFLGLQPSFPVPPEWRWIL